MRRENEENVCLPGNIYCLRSTQKAKTSSVDTGTKAEVWRNATINNLLPRASTTYALVLQQFCAELNIRQFFNDIKRVLKVSVD